MKTTDLIPIILYQLANGDRYGYEIIKQIEDSSNGEVVIKQPTLYTILKKLEQGRLISSYWQDSEIGGKRHYYKLTENGKMQLSTYPPLEQLLSNTLKVDETVDTVSNLNSDTNEKIGILDTQSPTVDLHVQNSDIVAKNDIVEVLDEISADNYLDDETITPSPINLSINDNTNRFVVEAEQPNTIKLDNLEQTAKPINIFDAIESETKTYTETLTIDNPAVETDNVSSKFAENIEPIVTQSTSSYIYDKLDSNAMSSASDIDTKSEAEYNLSPTEQLEQIKFLNYVNLANDKASIKRKQSITRHIQKMTLTCISLLIMLAITIVLCNKYSFSKLYYLCVVIAGLIVTLYPAITLSNYSKKRLKYCTKPFKYNLLQDLFIKLSIFLILVIAIFAYNLTIVNSVKSIFTTQNFANFLCPIIFSFIAVIDFMFSALLYKKYYTSK